jgi:outer membrane immunogenic protein
MGFNMKKFLVLLAFSTAMLAPSAKTMAADLETLPPPPPVEELRPAAYDWTGAYAGAWVGNACINGTLVDHTGGGTWLNAGCGIKGGGLMGYNVQFGDYVVGGEVDAGLVSNIVRNNDPGANYTMGLDFLATARARAGWAMDDTLFYVTGGGAWAQGNINGILPFTTPSNLKGQEFGWTVGGGVEHAVTDRFRLRLEYLYTHMIDTDYKAGCCNVTVNWGDEHEIKAAAIWAF